MNQVVNWFILIFIFVFDPFAVILLISANKAFDITTSNENEKIIIDDDETERRMDIIGQNGNDGLHYEEEPPSKGKTILR